MRRVCWLALLWSGLAVAQTPQPPGLGSTANEAINWIAPSQNTNGTPLTNLAGFKLYRRLCSAASYDPPIDIPGTVANYSLATQVPGTYCVALTAYNSVGAESAKSAVASWAVAGVSVNIVPPASPVTIAPTIYTVIKTEGNLVLLPVGTVPLGTFCDNTQGTIRMGKVYFVTSLEHVTWSGGAHPKVAVAACQ